MKKFKKIISIVLIIILILLIIINVGLFFISQKNNIVVYKIAEKTSKDIPIEGAFLKTNAELFLGIFINTHDNYDEFNYRRIELYSSKDSQLLKTEYLNKVIILTDYDVYHDYLDANLKLYLKIYYNTGEEEQIDINFKKTYQYNIKKDLENLKIKSSKEQVIAKINNLKNKLLLKMEPQGGFYFYQLNAHEYLNYFSEDNTVIYTFANDKNEIESYYFDLNARDLVYSLSIDGKEVKNYYYSLEGNYCEKDCEEYEEKEKAFEKAILDFLN